MYDIMEDVPGSGIQVVSVGLRTWLTPYQNNSIMKRVNTDRVSSRRMAVTVLVNGAALGVSRYISQSHGNIHEIT